MVASLPPLACALCDHPISPEALRSGLRCPRCNHRHGLGSKHRLQLAHIQRRRLQAAVDRQAAAEASGSGGAGLRFLAALAIAAALPPLLRTFSPFALEGDAWLVVAVGLVVAVAMAAALHLLLDPEEPSATTPVRIDAATVEQALLDAEAAAWRAGISRHRLAHRAAARGRVLDGAASVLLGVVAAGALLILLGFNGAFEAATVAPAALIAALVAGATRALTRGHGRELTAARRIAAALGPAEAPRLLEDQAAIARWMETRWAGPVDFDSLERGAGVAIERGDLEALATVVAARYVPLRFGVGRLAQPEWVRVFVPFVTPPRAARDGDTTHAAALVAELQASGWHLAHEPGVGLQATRPAPSEALHFPHDQLAAAAQTLPVLLDLATALGGVAPRTLRARELVSLTPARAST